MNIVTPNLEEAGKAVGKTIKSQEEVINAGKKLLKMIHSDYVLITQGKEGMTLFINNGEYFHLPVANLSEVYDVTGAGDTVVTTLVLAVCAGATVNQAVKLANYAAGIVVRKSGVATVKPEELIQEVRLHEF